MAKPKKSHVAREISYATSAKSKPGRVLIRAVENTTGRIRLIKRAKGYEDAMESGADFWQELTDRYGLSLDVVKGSLSNIPQTGPLVVVSNHPYGILDGLMLGFILSTVRGGDFRIIAHRIFRRAKELDEVILPISFDETREAMQTNIATRKEALRYLGDGGAIGIFPGGTVATSSKMFSRPIDPVWRPFTAKMVAKSEAAVVPIYFDGQNSRMFQIASHLHYTLRMALMIKEFKKRVDAPVRVAIGEPIDRAEIAKVSHDSRVCMDFLRQQTYALSPKPFRSLDYGYEFEENYRA